MTLQEVSDELKALTAKLDEALAAEPTTESAEAAEELSAKIEALEEQRSKLTKLEEIKTRHAERKSADDKVEQRGLPIVDPNKVVVGKTVLERSGKEAEVMAGAFLIATFNPAMRSAYKELTGIEYRTHTMANDAKGGIFVPQQVAAKVIDLQLQYGAYQRNATTEKMNSETLLIPRYGSDITAYWGGEGVAYTASDLDFDGVTLTAKKLTAMGVITDELIMNSAENIGQRWITSAARAFAKKIDEAGFNGDATSTYGGFTGVRTALKGLSGTIANIAGLTVATGNTFDEFTLANFITTKNNLPEYAHGKAKWYMNRVTFGATAERVALAAGGVTAAEITGALGQRFLGNPVEFVEVMPKTDGNSQVSILFGDLGAAASFGDRQQISVKQDTSKGFDQDLVYIKQNQYCDVTIHSVGNASATAASRQAGPIVGLISAAS